MLELVYNSWGEVLLSGWKGLLDEVNIDVIELQGWM